MSSVRILAPAKVNLGLAILGKRPDGYHEIDTIMAMIDLCDEIVLSPADKHGITISGMDETPAESNLMTKAALLWSKAVGEEAAWHIDIEKRIPSPAGIGGGSSDAAAILLALNALNESPLSEDQLHNIAARVGADCPFFLSGPAARATGIGTDLQPIDTPKGWVVLAVPSVADAAKTTKLYNALTPDDYGTSTHIDDVAKLGVHSALMPNSFMRPAISAFPELESINGIMESITGRVMLSGAGPALYSIAHSESTAVQWAEQIRAQVPGNVQIFTAEFLQSRPQPELLP